MLLSTLPLVARFELPIPLGCFGTQGLNFGTTRNVRVRADKASKRGYPVSKARHYLLLIYCLRDSYLRVGHLDGTSFAEFTSLSHQQTTTAPRERVSVISRGRCKNRGSKVC